MPRLIQVRQIKLERADVDSVVSNHPHTQPRSPGVHLSGMIRVVMHAKGLWSLDDDLDEFPLRMAMGVAWEDWVMERWPGIQRQPGECRKDGVSGSPDGISSAVICDECKMPMSNPDPMMPCPCGVRKWVMAGVVEECKLTWKSKASHPIDKEVAWLWQGAGYCTMLGLNFCRLHITWVNGDYKQGPPEPMYFTYLFHYTDQELEEFWQGIVMANVEAAKPEPGQYCDGTELIEGRIVACGLEPDHDGSCDFVRVQ